MYTCFHCKFPVPLDDCAIKTAISVTCLRCYQRICQSQLPPEQRHELAMKPWYREAITETLKTITNYSWT